MSHWRKRNLPAKQFNSDMVRLAVGLLMLSAVCIGFVLAADHHRSGPQRTASIFGLSTDAPDGQDSLTVPVVPPSFLAPPVIVCGLQRGPDLE
jgi:hypothetical protein